MALSLCSNVAILLSYYYLCHEMDVDYFVVEEMSNISKLFD
jgi:hypothetical protein